MMAASNGRCPPMRLSIDVISDVVCPWCFVGKRRLEAALLQLRERESDVDARISWHPFQLNPDLPAEGVDRRAYLEAKFGGPKGADEVYARIRVAGRSVGVEFAFDRIKRQANTLDAHRLISWAQSRGDAGPLVEALFHAYFLEGRFVGDRSTLAAIAGEAGLDADAARAFLDSGELADRIAAMDARVRELGVDGVPFFIFDDKVAVSGAQEPGTLLEAIAQARAAG